jgi:hypothetical protein
MSLVYFFLGWTTGWGLYWLIDPLGVRRRGKK